MGAVENLSVGQFAFQVHDDALPQGDQPGQVVLKRLVHEPKDSTPEGCFWSEGDEE
jgi:hypothetical protein